MKKIDIKGAIVSNNDADVYDYFGLESTSPNKVEKAILEANFDDLEVVINSGGGDVFSASVIYTALKSYKGNVTVKIVGLAASAASVIAMAGKKVLMSPTAQLMIHNVSTYTGGDYRDMEHAAEVLKNANETIANAYRLKTGKSQEELLGLMDKESWFTADKAKEIGFIDEVMFETNQLVASKYSGMLPPEVIQTIKNQKLNSQITDKIDVGFLNSKLKLLKMKGAVNE